MATRTQWDIVVVGGGPAGATAATDLARRGQSVLLLDRPGRIKPCGGAIPPKLIEEFGVPQSLLVAKIKSARMVAPSERTVDMPINGGYVGMVDREVFDPWLRQRAAIAGAECRAGQCTEIAFDAQGRRLVRYITTAGEQHEVTTKAIIGADGAESRVRRSFMQAQRVPYVYAYHEIVESPEGMQNSGFDGERCDVYYQGNISPDFYGWIFPHGKTISIGVGTALKGYSLRAAVAKLRSAAGLTDMRTVRREGAPIPLRVLRRWDNGLDVVLTGDAAGVVAPASGEGIYYAMTTGRLAAEAVEGYLLSGDARALAQARKRFMRAHGKVFWVLDIMQRFWYSSDRRRERFVSMCRDPDVQTLTWQAYMHKKLVRAKPMAHVRIFFKDLAHLAGLHPL